MTAKFCDRCSSSVRVYNFHSYFFAENHNSCDLCEKCYMCIGKFVKEFLEQKHFRVVDKPSKKWYNRF